MRLEIFSAQLTNARPSQRKPPSSKKNKAQADAAAAAAAVYPPVGPSYPSPHGNGYPGAPGGLYGAPPGSAGGGVGGPGTAEWNNVLQQLDSLARTQSAMQQHMSNLSADYQAVIGEMINFQRNMVAQDQLMQNMIQYLVSLEAGQLVCATVPQFSKQLTKVPLADQRGATSTQDSSAPYVPSSQAQKLISSYTEVARASYDQMADLTRRASLSGAQFSNMPPLPPAPPSFDQFEFAPLRDGPPPQQQPQQQQQNGVHHSVGPYETSHVSSSMPPPLPKSGPAPQAPPQQQQQGPRIDTRPTPRQPPVSQYVHPAYANDPSYGAVTSPTHPTNPNSHMQQQSHQQPQPPAHQRHSGPISTGRRESAVPGWALPPRVLLVEDDTVCRKLSSKFLEKFGCEIDVAVDGVSAVNKMNVQKYDLVLMVRAVARDMLRIPLRARLT